MIPIGLVLSVTESLPSEIARCAADGFESVSLFVWEHSAVADLSGVLSRSYEAAQSAGIDVSTLSIYGNPLRTDEVGESVRRLWHTLLSEAEKFSVPVVTGFAGRVVGDSVEASIPAWKAFFEPLAERAGAANLRLAFENCRLGDTWKTGKWNIAINPDAWETMFAALDVPHVGLEWEPCHQLESLADPHIQLADWARRVFHVHGKDARVDKDALAGRGFYAKNKWHSSVLPGAGDSDWRRLLATLERSDYRGSVDLEFPTPVDLAPEDRRVEEIKSLQYMKLSR